MSWIELTSVYFPLRGTGVAVLALWYLDNNPTDVSGRIIFVTDRLKLSICLQRFVKDKAVPQGSKEYPIKYASAVDTDVEIPLSVWKNVWCFTN